MSFCRWSSDDFRSDLYVIGTETGFTIYVASNRVLIDRSALPEITTSSEADHDAWFDEWYARRKALGALVDDCEREPLGLPYDGQTVDLTDQEDAAQTVEWLEACGYHVPEGVAAAIRADDFGEGETNHE